MSGNVIASSAITAVLAIVLRSTLSLAKASRLVDYVEGILVAADNSIRFGHFTKQQKNKQKKSHLFSGMHWHC